MIIGLVGKPSAGKSTFFKAATLAEAEIANYPFTTIKPNSGVGYVKLECVEKFFNVKCNPREGFCIHGNGLVPGAHEGKGMGNQFLNDLIPADVLIHVVDISGSINEIGEPVTPLSYDPLKDIEFLEYEMEMWILQIISKGWEKFARTAKQEKAKAVDALLKQLTGLKVTKEMIEEVIKPFPTELEKWTEQDLRKFAKEIRQRNKPLIIAANKIDVPGAEENFERAKQKFTNLKIIPCSAESELALREAAKKGLIEYIPGEGTFKILNKEKLSESQIKALNFIQKNILDKFKSTGVQQVLDIAIFDLLKYMPVFPGGLNNLVDRNGNVLPDCFLMPKNSTALDFAFRIHTDLGKGFIRAIDVKTKRTVGKEHLLKFGDVVEIISNK